MIHGHLYRLGEHVQCTVTDSIMNIHHLNGYSVMMRHYAYIGMLDQEQMCCKFTVLFTHLSVVYLLIRSIKEYSFEWWDDCELWIGEGVKWSRSKLRYYPSICLDRMRRTMTSLSQVRSHPSYSIILWTSINGTAYWNAKWCMKVIFNYICEWELLVPPVWSC